MQVGRGEGGEVRGVIAEAIRSRVGGRGGVA
jgi:hypothetical protein